MAGMKRQRILKYKSEPKAYEYLEEIPKEYREEMPMQFKKLKKKKKIKKGGLAGMLSGVYEDRNAE